MDISERYETYRKNLSLISEIYPQYTTLISSAPESDPAWEILEAGPNTYHCRFRQTASKPSFFSGEESEEWIHGPGDPWIAALQAIQEVQWETQRLFIIIRPGLGYLPQTLYPRLQKGRSAQRMLLVEDRISLFRRALTLFDWTDVLRSDRTILLLPENPGQAILDFITTNPVTILQPTAVLCGVVWREEERRILGALQKVFSELLQTVSNASRDYINDLHQHYRRIAQEPAHRKKILLVEPEHDYLSEPIAEAFRAEGCDVNFFRGNRRMLNFVNPYAWLVYTRENFPDLLLWMNRNTLSPEGVETLSLFPIRKVLWFLDSPKRVETSREEIEATDAYYSFDPTYLPYLKTLGGKEGFYLPTAAGIRPLPECEPGKPWPRREGPALSFVGALAAARFQNVREFWLGRDPEFVQILDELVETHLRNPAQTLEELYESSPGRARLPYSGFVVLYLEERATYLRRLRLLQSVVDSGLSTYGSSEWQNPEWAERLTPCYAGYAPRYREDLPGEYYHAKININIFHAQCVNSPNPRVYDVMAAGGFLLTEYRPALADEFRIGEHLVCFSTPEELREKARYYLEHEEEREAVARAGQLFVSQHATYRARIRRILEIP